METRLASLRTDLEQKLAEVSALPLHDLGESTRTAVVSNVMAEMGDAASIVDSLEIQPFTVPVMVAAAAPRAEPPPPPPPGEPIVINVPTPPAMARFTWTGEQKAQLKEITRLGMKLGGWQSLTPAEREETQKQLETIQQSFDASMRKSQFEYHKHLAASREEAREAHREAMDTPPVATAPVVKIPLTRVIRRISPAEKERLRERQKEASLLFGRRLDSPMRSKGEVVGKVSAQVSTPEVFSASSAAQRRQRRDHLRPRPRQQCLHAHAGRRKTLDERRNHRARPARIVR